jgi:hypothetical protein
MHDKFITELAVRRVLPVEAARRWLAGDATATDEAGEDAIAREVVEIKREVLLAEGVTL